MVADISKSYGRRFAPPTPPRSKSPDLSSLQIVYEDFNRALDEVEPKFGAKTADMEGFFRGGIVNYGEVRRDNMKTALRATH